MGQMVHVIGHCIFVLSQINISNHSDLVNCLIFQYILIKCLQLLNTQIIMHENIANTHLLHIYHSNTVPQLVRQLYNLK